MHQSILLILIFVIFLLIFFLGHDRLRSSRPYVFCGDVQVFGEVLFFETRGFAVILPSVSLNSYSRILNVPSRITYFKIVGVELVRLLLISLDV